MKKLVLVDAHAVIHRAYHALPPLTTSSGEPTNAVYGFTTIFLRILRELKPDYIAAAFDLPGPTFRHIAYERYKAQRPETPAELSSQFAKVREVLEAFGVPVFEKEGYEADDVIGTIARKFEKDRKVEIIIVTGDMDTLQLVRTRVRVYAMKKGITETVTYDEKAVEERYGFKPEQVVDFKGLKGDPSDNIPGVKGIGEKTATELIKEFGSIDGVYKALKKGTKKISPAIAEKLRQGKEDARFSLDLATINTKVPVKFGLEAMKYREKKDGKVSAVFQKLGFYSLLKRLNVEGAPKSEQAALLVVPARTRAIEELTGVAELEQVFKNAPRTGLVLEKEDLFLIPEKGGRVYKLDPKLLKEDKVKRFFETQRFFVHNGKALIHFLHRFNIEPGPVEFDIMLAAYLTSQFTRDFSFLAVASRELGRLVSQNPRDEISHFFEIVESLKSKLSEGKIKKVFEEIELPAVRVLADMEERGILIDAAFLKRLAQEVDKKLEDLTALIYKLAGGNFNINSSQQLSRILFEKLNIKTHGLRKTEKGGVISTGASELEKLKGEHPIIVKILGYRELIKLKTTYIDTLPRLVNPKTGRLHTTYNQTGTATGRLSSSDPNLQNIPIMTELGREIRKAFVAQDEYELVSFDYSQIELRVAAHIANDKKMIEAFKKGMDIHKLTASEIYNIPLEKVTPDLRRAAKTLNFGVLYGMGSQAFAESMARSPEGGRHPGPAGLGAGMSREDAKKFIDEYFHDFSGVKKYIEDTKRFVEENGYVETIFGRRRYIPEIHSPNWQLRREAERMAINMPIQGSSTGDIIKLAMIKVDEWIRKAAPEGREKLENGVRMLLQVHDELLFEIKKRLVQKVTPQIRKIMEGAVELKVPLVVDAKTGRNWGEQKSL
ncbi:MAG: DNA polymerase I [Candidatus Sungiibacteriota bacterium]|uniref:DNA polymerase I n=1 Tax=Candidatus Sungiibacteriota bacterium TaxID=2750080 RepID=A0A7T5URR4_9BACT|nr:MAG: DNA polymerase I [Candidatus Sungbacteria bacterium]